VCVCVFVFVFVCVCVCGVFCECGNTWTDYDVFVVVWYRVS
jgi:hypothetical protein